MKEELKEKKETWVQWVALTTTVLAVAAAISSLKASSYSTRVQIWTTREANQWAYYQSKSIKEHNFELSRDLFLALNSLSDKALDRAYLEKKIAWFNQEISRYDREKKEIKADAEKLIAEQEVLKRHNANFALAVMLLQIAIMMSAVSALIKRKALWVAGLCMGVIGLCYMANGFWLFF